jgi:hypothetical protein
MRELFRKKRSTHDDEQDLRELLKKDRGDLLREFEKLLDSQKTLDNLASPSEPQIDGRYRSVSTQTKMPERPSRHTPPNSESRAMENPEYTFSSTQTDPEVVEEATPIVITQADDFSLPLGVSPASVPSEMPPAEPFIFGNIADGAEASSSMRVSVPIRKSRSVQSLSCPSIPTNTPQPEPGIVLSRKQRYSIDGETGVIRLWKVSKIRFQDKKLVVCLPPQNFQGHLPRKSERILLQTMSPSGSISRDMERVRESVRARGDGGGSDSSDDGDEEDNGADAQISTTFRPFDAKYFKGAKFVF